jgi:hypothetical protein
MKIANHSPINCDDGFDVVIVVHVHDGVLSEEQLAGGTVVAMFSDDIANFAIFFIVWRCVV